MRGETKEGGKEKNKRRLRQGESKNYETGRQTSKNRKKNRKRVSGLNSDSPFLGGRRWSALRELCGHTHDNVICVAEIPNNATLSDRDKKKRRKRQKQDRKMVRNLEGSNSRTILWKNKKQKHSEMQQRPIRKSFTCPEANNGERRRKAESEKE